MRKLANDVLDNTLDPENALPSLVASMKPKNKLPPWLRPKIPPTNLSVGVSWYTEVEWAKVKAVAVDSERLEETYAEWLKMAERALADLRATGIGAEKSYVNALELLAWCLAHNKPNDGAARAQFVSEQGRKGNEVGV